MDISISDYMQVISSQGKSGKMNWQAPFSYFIECTCQASPQGIMWSKKTATLKLYQIIWCWIFMLMHKSWLTSLKTKSVNNIFLCIVKFIRAFTRTPVKAENKLWGMIQNARGNLRIINWMEVALRLLTQNRPLSASAMNQILGQVWWIWLSWLCSSSMILNLGAGEPRKTEATEQLWSCLLEMFLIPMQAACELTFRTSFWPANQNKTLGIKLWGFKTKRYKSSARSGNRGKSFKRKGQRGSAERWRAKRRSSTLQLNSKSTQQQVRFTWVTEMKWERRNWEAKFKFHARMSSCFLWLSNTEVGTEESFESN